MSGNAGYNTRETGPSAYQEWLQKNGFSADGQTLCVFGDDTYAIKDELKRMGCKVACARAA